MRRAALLALFILLLLPARSSFALSCAELPTAEKAYAYYDGIVIGHVDKVSTGADGASNELQITVSHSFKTITERTLVLKENSTWGALNGPSKAGEDYLFYLKQTDSGWENPLCSPSAKVSSDSVTPDFLKDKEIELQPLPSPEPADSGNLAENTPIDAWTIGGLIVIGIFTGITIVRHHRKKG